MKPLPNIRTVDFEFVAHVAIAVFLLNARIKNDMQLFLFFRLQIQIISMELRSDCFEFHRYQTTYLHK